MSEGEIGRADSQYVAADESGPLDDTPQFEALAPGEVVLDDENEYHLRQCNPNWLQNGKPSSQAFAYFQKDEGRLSGSRSRDVTPIQAFTFFTETLKLQSAATFAVSVAQVTASRSRVVDDTNAPTVRPPDPVPPGHAYIDLRHLSNGERKKLARGLSRSAVQVHPDNTNQLPLESD